MDNAQHDSDELFYGKRTIYRLSQSIHARRLQTAKTCRGVSHERWRTLHHTQHRWQTHYRL